MPLTAGSRLGTYEIVSLLGAGGMGEVYRARDTQLGREVALKVLPAALAEDADYMARFQREAQMLAALNHPNIAQIYGLEHNAIAMELVEGVDLHGPLPVDEAIELARQLAGALEAAHERGIVHRDLKPANIKVTPEGAVKVLDFGLAKATEISADARNSPAISVRATQAGLILGTASYMSPEQAKGRSVDRRADIWAFGAIFYEMLTGKPLYPGDNISEILATVILNDPDLSAVPAALRPLIERCLRKDVQRRWQWIGDVRLALEEGPKEPERQAAKANTTLPWVIASLALAAAVALAIVAWQRAPSPAKTVRLTLPFPMSYDLPQAEVVAVSPDGTRVAFAPATKGQRQLWVRELDAVESRFVPGTEGAERPFWSPDSRSIGFFAGGKLKKVAVTGGPVQTLCDAATARGASWNRSGDILFTPETGGPIYRVSADGGSATAVTSLDKANGESSHRFACFLPDGHHFLYYRRHPDSNKGAIWLGDLKSAEARRILAVNSNPVYSGSGHLLFMKETTLMAQRFDAVHAELAGEAFPIAEHVDFEGGLGGGNFSASNTGVLAYMSGARSNSQQLTWLDGEGKQLGVIGLPGNISSIAISPDGETVAFDRFDGENANIWTYDVRRNTTSRLTFDSKSNRSPVWSPDGARILFTSTRNRRYEIYEKMLQSSEPERMLPLPPATGLRFPRDVSRSGYLLFDDFSRETNFDVFGVALSGGGTPFPAAATPGSERNGKIAADGQWVAYWSTESGRGEIYAQTFPGGKGKVQISTAGGENPIWSRDGKRIFFLAPDRKMMAVDVTAGARLAVGTPRALFEVRTAAGQVQPYDVSPDGRRFLVAVLPEPGTPLITVVLNWNAGLKK